MLGYRLRLDARAAPQERVPPHARGAARTTLAAGVAGVRLLWVAVAALAGGGDRGRRADARSAPLSPTAGRCLSASATRTSTARVPTPAATRRCSAWWAASWRTPLRWGRSCCLPTTVRSGRRCRCTHPATSPALPAARVPGQRGFVLRGQGSTQINAVPSYATYNIFYTTHRAGRQMYGRDVLLLPERPGARRGVRSRCSPRSPATAR